MFPAHTRSFCEHSKGRSHGLWTEDPTVHREYQPVSLRPPHFHPGCPALLFRLSLTVISDRVNQEPIAPEQQAACRPHVPREEVTVRTQDALT